MIEFFDSDRNLILTLIVVFSLVFSGVVYSFATYHYPPTLHMNVKVTSERTYDSALFSSRLGTVSSPVEDIYINATHAIYTLSCTYYSVNDTLAMTNNGSYGYQMTNGQNTPWTFDSLQIGCELFQVVQA